MHRHFEDELKLLKQRLIKMALLVEESLEKAVNALFENESRYVVEVMETEKRINQLELEIDDMGRSLSALQHPVAKDLRLVATVLKINTDLERMGDHAVNIAEKTTYVGGDPALCRNLNFEAMFKAVRRMLNDAISAFMTGDATLAKAIKAQDDEVDEYDVALYEKLSKIIAEDPSTSKSCLNLLMIGHNLERIADLACNIAEDVIYMEEGSEVRHMKDQQEGAAS